LLVQLAIAVLWRNAVWQINWLIALAWPYQCWLNWRNGWRRNAWLASSQWLINGVNLQAVIRGSNATSMAGWRLH
jgi:hypothetical protein